MKCACHVPYMTSQWNKPLIDTCQYCSTSRANEALRSLANAGFQNRGICLLAFPSFPTLTPFFNFLAFVSFLTRPKYAKTGLSLLRNQTETLTTQANLYFTMDHFRITFGLFFKASPGAHLFIWKLISFACEWKLIFIWKDEHQDSLWKRGQR